MYRKAYGSGVRIEILHVPGCPNLATLRRRVQAALADAGRAAAVLEIEVATEQDAARLGMRGSPTVLLEGHDPFGTAEPSLSCRLYRTDQGIDGAPSVEQLAEVLS